MPIGKGKISIASILTPQQRPTHGHKLCEPLAQGPAVPARAAKNEQRRGGILTV